LLAYLKAIIATDLQRVIQPAWISCKCAVWQQVGANAMTRETSFGARVPPHAFFVVSAFFRYLGPAFAVLLFGRVETLGVAWLRIAAAAGIFAVWRRPWRLWWRLSATQRGLVASMGVVLAAMNCVFYEAIARLPLGTVGAIEFLGPIALAATGTRTARNAAALVLVIVGVSVLTDVRLAGEPLGYLLAFANCALFIVYIVLGHRLAADGAGSGIDRLSVAMLVAMLTALPVGVRQAAPAFINPLLLGAAVGVGVCSSVIPYVCDQVTMARLQRATFALMLALLPATATGVGLIVLRQIPSPLEVLGVALVAAGVSVHRGQRVGEAPGGDTRRYDGALNRLT
jgi:inner membrane transporter RhtA